MPASKTKRKYKRMAAKHILRRIRSGTLLVDVIEGEVFVRRDERADWRPLTIERTRNYERRFVRLYYKGRRCGIMLNRLVWIAAHMRPIPRGWQVHHKDGNRKNDCWANLECLDKQAHLEAHF